MQRNMVLLASAARTTTTTTNNIPNVDINTNVRGVIVTLDVTAIASSPSIVPQIEFYDIASGKYEIIMLVSAAVTGTGTHSYLLYPQSGVAANGITQVANFPLPSIWRVVVTHGNSDSITYSLGASFLP